MEKLSNTEMNQLIGDVQDYLDNNFDNDKAKETYDELWKSICEETSDNKERIQLLKNFMKAMKREDKLDDLLDSEDSEN